MMTIIFAILSDILIAAHFFRADKIELVYLTLAFIPLLFVRYAEARRVHQLFTIFSAALWINTAYTMAIFRISFDMPYIRMVVILSCVSLFSLASAYFQSKRIDREKEKFAPTIAFFLTLILLLIVSTKTPYPMILGHRFFGDLGHLQIMIHGCYSAVLAKLFLSRQDKGKIRRAIWSTFSIIFFLQLALGLSGFESFLQTGELHYPVPAMILAGPIYRGEGIFMIILLLSTIVLVGPSWCSHLCYVGSIDNYLARKKNKVGRLPGYVKNFRYLVLLVCILLPLVAASLNLGKYFIHTVVAGYIALSFVFFYLSYQYGKMVHCAHFCPIGVITNVLGKINPMRLKIGSDCNLCNLCVKKCSFNALDLKSLKRGSPNLNCTLCMDCIPSCPKKTMSVKFFGREGLPTFYAIIVTLHSIFLAVARI